MARLPKSRDGTKARSKNKIVARLLWLRNLKKAQMKAETMAQLPKSRDGTKARSKNKMVARLLSSRHGIKAQSEG